MALGRKTGGRQKGTPNHNTTELKGAILAAFGHLGGQAYLVRVGKENPQVFCTLLGKVLPMTVQGDAEHPLTITVATGVVRE